MAKRVTTIGLDIGRYSVKAAWVEQRNGTAGVTHTEILRLPSERTEMKSVLAPWIVKHGFAKYPCVLGISGQQCMFQPFLLPPADPRTYEQATAMEVIRFNEMASETMNYGYAPFSFNPGERRVMLAMARPTLLEDLLKLGKDLGLDVVDIVPAPVAMFNALELISPAHDAPSLYMNIGQGSTEIAVGLKSGLLFARGFSGGGQMFTDALASSAKLPFSQAENLKLSEASLVKAGDPNSTALSRAADVWLSEVHACMSVYQSLYSGKRTAPSRIVLVGAGSELRGLPEYLAEKMKVEVIRPPLLPGQADPSKSVTFAVAAGLAISAMGSPTTAISLLPPDTRDELMFRRQKPFWIAAGITGALVLGVSLAGGSLDFRRMEKHLVAQDRILTIRQNLGADIDNAKARNAQIHEMAKPVKELLSGGPLMRGLLKLITDSLAPGDWITMISDGESYVAKELVQPAPAGMRDRRRAIKPQDKFSKTGGFDRIIIEGYTQTPNLSTVKKLIAVLEAAGYVASADLLSDDKLVSPENTAEIRGAQRFVLEIKVKGR